MNQNREYLGWLSRINQAVVLTILFTGLWIVLAVVCMAFFRTWPKTALGWVVGLLAAPVVFILAEGLAGLVAAGFGKIPLVSRARQDIEERNKDKTVSSERIMFVLVELVVMAAILGGIVYGIYRLSGDSFAPAVTFFKENFH